MDETQSNKLAEQLDQGLYHIRVTDIYFYIEEDDVELEVTYEFLDGPFVGQTFKQTY